MTEDLAQLTARNQAFLDENRKELTRKLARELGQPEDTPLHVLTEILADERKKKLARETEDLAQLTARNQAFLDENRKELTRKLARELGQPEDTPLHVLTDLKADERRKQLALELGQPEDTPLWKLNDLD